MPPKAEWCPQRRGAAEVERRAGEKTYDFSPCDFFLQFFRVRTRRSPVDEQNGPDYVVVPNFGLTLGDAPGGLRSAGRTRKTSQDRALPQPWVVAEERSPTPPSLRRGKQNRSTSPGIRLILASRRSWATGTQSQAWPSSLLPSSRRSRWPSSKRQNLRASRCSSSTGACNPQAPRPPAALVHWCTRACTRALVHSCARALGTRPHRYQVAP